MLVTTVQIARRVAPGCSQISAIGMILLAPFAGWGQVSVPTQHNNTGRTGANLSETILNTSNVNVNQFGKLFTRTIDGQAYAQPLYVGGVKIGQTLHNVVYVATMNNTVYAFDADDTSASAPLWQVNLGPAFPMTDVVAQPSDIIGVVGITGTPAIDLSTGTLYCVAKTKEGTSYFQRLHALDLTNGQEKFGGPAVIQGSVPGTGDSSVGGNVPFVPQQHLNRPALLFLNGYVYIAFGSHEDDHPYHGWVFSYNGTTLQRAGIYNVTPNGWGGSIWQSGQGLVDDGNGYVYFMTANGTFNMNTGGPNCSSCFIKLSTPFLNVVDWFSPSDQNLLNSDNWDLNSSGPLVIPGTNLIMGGGKEGVLYVVNHDTMGHFVAGSNPQIPQSLQITWGDHLHGSPVYWASPDHGPLVYVWHEQDHLKAFNMVNGLFQNPIDPNTGLSMPLAMSTMGAPDGMPGGMQSISANGSAAGTGIVWSTLPFSGDAHLGIVPGIVRAFNASNVAVELWNSKQNAARDDLGLFAKFSAPTVANGKVYVGTFSNQLVVYGLLNTAPAPTVANVSPNSGDAAGGTPVTITGTNFAAGATVTFGGIAATGVNVPNTGTITATTPAHVVGAVAVAVRNSDGQTGTLAGGFTYTSSAPAPTVGTVSPNSGPVAGGTGVTITGTNFVAGATVTFGATAATGVIVVGGTSITATTPTHLAGAVSVTVTNPDGQSGALPSGFTYIAPPPTVSSVSPASGTMAGGTAVTITGTNFVAGATVTFGGTAATSVNVTSATSITATAPAHAVGAVDVTVTNSDTQNGTRTNGFTYTLPAPTVSSVSPASGTTAGGTAVTIAGTNFVTGATVMFGGIAATGVSVVSGISITATTPAHAAGAVTVAVTNPDLQSGTRASAFTYSSTNPAPTVSGVSPTSGPATGGTPVTITGTNFLTGATVTFGGTAATGVSVLTSTTISATTPAHAAGAVAVRVTNTDGKNATLNNGFTYTNVTVTSVAPATGPTTGGTGVTITGTNFLTGATVTFGGTAATGVIVVGSTSITASTPAHAVGAVTVTVTNTTGQNGSRASGFTYTSTAPAPTVSSVAPTSGPTAGGTPVTITGTNFVAGASVAFGGTAATGVNVGSSTSITATTPAHTTGAVSVSVVNPDGQIGTRANGFTYNGAAPAISFVQVGQATPQSPTATVAVPFPSAQTAGDLNIIVVGWNDATALVQTLRDSAGNMYNLAIGPTTGTGLRQSIYYAANILGGANTVTVTFNQPAIYADIRILEYRGLSALDATAGASGTGTTADSGSALTTSANELIFGANTVSSYNLAVGSGFTLRVVTTIDSDLGEDKIVATAGTYNANASVGSGFWVMQMATFR